MKGVQCYELFGGIALRNYAFKKTTLNILNSGSEIDVPSMTTAI